MALRERAVAMATATGTARAGVPARLARQMVGNSLVRNSVLAMGTTVGTSLLGYAFWVLAARSFSSHDVGVATAVISAFTLASLLSEFGAHSAMVQLLPGRTRGEAWSRTVNAALLVGIGAGVLAAVVAIAVLGTSIEVLAPMRDDAVVALLFGGGVVLTTATLVLDFVFVAERESGKMLVRNLVTSGVKLPLLALATVVAARSSTLILAAWVASLLVGLVVAVGVMLPRLDRGYRPSLGGLRREARAIRAALVGQHLISIGGTVPMYVLPLLVTARLSAEDNAHFYTTWMVGSLFFMVSSWIATALFAEGSHRPADLPAKLRHSIQLTAAIALPAMAVTILGGHAILRVFGPGYATGYVLLVVLTLSAVPDAVTNLYVAVLRIHGRIRAAAGLNIAMAGLAVAISWVLLPVVGIAGAGIAWLGAQTVGALWVLIDGRRHPLEPAPEP